MTKPLAPSELRLPPAAAAKLRRRLRRDGARSLVEIAGVSTETLISAAAEVPIRRASRLAIERLLADDPVGEGAPGPSASDDEGEPDGAAS